MHKKRIILGRARTHRTTACELSDFDGGAVSMFFGVFFGGGEFLGINLWNKKKIQRELGPQLVTPC